MHHDTPLITTIVAGLVLAYIFGMVANRFRMPPLVGYLFAGILVGPYSPGFVADVELGKELAELGVILLMFGVGLHFSLKDLMSVRALAIPGAVAQIGFATILGMGLGILLGWDLFGAILFGLALSVASTVVLLKALQDRRLIETERGRIAVGWLIVEDLAMVLALVLVPAIASVNGGAEGVHDPFVSFVARMAGMDIGIWGILGLTLIKVAAFVGFMLVVGRRLIPWALHATAHTGSRELFRLAVLAIALGVALGSAVLFGVSLALGAFFAGMILSESELSHRAAQETLPLRDAFSVLFFVSVGMLFDPSIIVTDPLPVLATVFIIVIGKSVAAYGIVLLFRRPVSTALTISASLAQIGEFSFILASMGVSLAVMPSEGQDLILAGALISIVLNPVAFFVVDAVKPRLEAKVARRRGEPAGEAAAPMEPSFAANGPATTDAPGEAALDRGGPGADDDTPEPSTQTGHTVLVGYGQVGRIVAAGIKADGGGLVVIEDSDHDVAAARAEGFEVVFGNAASEQVLKLANLGAAQTLLVAISNGFEAGSVCESGRKLNSGISIIARAYSEEEDSFLRSCGATTVIRGEREIGKGILTFMRAAGVETAVEPEDTRLPVADNILAKAGAGVAVAHAPEVLASAELEPAAPPQAVIVEAPESPAPAAEVADLAVIEAIEGTQVSAAVVPEGETAHASGLPDVATETAAATPAVGESPAAIEEPVASPPEMPPADTEPVEGTSGDQPAQADDDAPDMAPQDEASPAAAPPDVIILGPPPAADQAPGNFDAGTPEGEADVAPAETSAPAEMPPDTASSPDESAGAAAAAGSEETPSSDTGADTAGEAAADKEGRDDKAVPPVIPEPKG
ncbi:cation:proton antiporter [Devosia sp. PTR5]|uniref:Cation:proton antiporter n=1 Tax=Devosia oryzisoli TaxID=2774138 RepID=A0A927FYI0_9HYPH|nr:cation:proton antiporter [Devosia oryzisoli]